MMVEEKSKSLIDYEKYKGTQDGKRTMDANVARLARNDQHFIWAFISGQKDESAVLILHLSDWKEVS